MDAPVPAVRFAEGTDDLLEGLLVPYGGSFNGRDSYGTYATPQTRFCLDLFPEGSRPLMYHHGLDKDIGPVPVGRIRSLEAREHGIWMQAQLDLHNQYVREIRELVDKGALGLSSGALAHLVEIDARSGAWIQWPIAEGSLTPAPANLLATIDVPTFKSHIRSAGIELPQPLVDHLERGTALEGAPPQPDGPTVVATWAVVQTQRSFDALEHGQKIQLYYDVALRSASMPAGMDALRAVWSTAYVNSLPDDAFLIVEDGGSKDEEGKTTPRALRHFPVKSKEGSLDEAHVRNALARIPQSSLSDNLKSKALAKCKRYAKQLGIEVGEDSGRSAPSSPHRLAPRASYEGSYEELMDALRSQLNPAGPWSQGYTSIRETYPDYVLCTHWSADPDEPPTAWRVAYTLDEEGQPVLGARTPAEGPAVRAAPPPASIAAFNEESSYLYRQITAWHELAKALAASRAAKERPLSPDNCRAITKVRSALLEVASSLHDINADAEATRTRLEQIAHNCAPEMRKHYQERFAWTLAATLPEATTPRS